MTYPKRKHPELPYWAARKLEKIGLELAEIVLVRGDQGVAFAGKLTKLQNDLAQIRRALLSGVVMEEGDK